MRRKEGEKGEGEKKIRPKKGERKEDKEGVGNEREK